MITDQETNIVYFSNLLEKENRNEFNQLRFIIEEKGYDVKLLIETDDIYCRDYMPVHVGAKDFVQFVFSPTAYFDKDEYKGISHPVYVGLMNDIIQPRYSPIIIDGGNVIKWEGKAIVTDRVLKDNRYQFPNDKAIVQRLEFDLKCKVIIIPEYPNEETGHADGLIRFIDSNRVFINDTKLETEKLWLSDFLTVLERHNLTPMELPCEVDPKQTKAEGLYINYLHIGDLIVVPQFGYKKSDREALLTIERTFNEHNVIPYKANWIAEGGGVLNCCSWTIKE